MTVCVATICENYQLLVLASDRTLTAGDIQFQHPGGKTYFLTSSIALMLAGDTTFQAQIATRVARAVSERVAKDPQNWWLVEDVAGLWHDYYADEKRKLGEAAYLRPLGLTSSTFIAQQRTMLPQIVEKLTDGILYSPVPDSQAIIAGNDSVGVHIFSTTGQDVRRDTTIGFAAIGSGAYHADSFLALWPYSQGIEASLAVWLTYAAKCRAQIDAFVGVETDMHIVGPNLGQRILLPPNFITSLSKTYEKLRAQETRLGQRLADDAKARVSALIAKAASTRQQAPQPGEPIPEASPPAVDDGKGG